MSLEDVFQTAHETNLKECEKRGIFARQYDNNYGACIYFAKPLCPYKIIKKEENGEMHLCSRWLKMGIKNEKQE